MGLFIKSSHKMIKVKSQFAPRMTEKEYEITNIQRQVDIDGVSTTLLSIDYADCVYVLVTQVGRIGCLLQATPRSSGAAAWTSVTDTEIDSNNKTDADVATASDDSFDSDSEVDDDVRVRTALKTRDDALAESITRTLSKQIYNACGKRLVFSLALKSIADTDEANMYKALMNAIVDNVKRW